MFESLSLLGAKYLTPENILLVGSILLFVSIIVSKTGYRFGVPTLLLFLFVGMFFGNDGLGFQFENVEVAQFIGMVALCIILFAGGMDTKISAIRPVIAPGVVLSTLGVLLTAFLTSAFIFFYSQVKAPECAPAFVRFLLADRPIYYLFTLLIASTMASTDSASVFALLRSQKMNLKENLQPMLELESGSNDPMAYLMVLVLISVIGNGGNMDIVSVLGSFLTQFAVGIVFGYVAGKIVVYVLNHLNMENVALYPIMVVSFAFFTYALTDRLKGNGYLAVYLAGLVVGNSRIANKKEIMRFMDGLSWLFQIIMFLTLGLLVNPTDMLKSAGLSFLVGIFMILFGRPLSVFLCLLPFRKISFKSKLFVSWVGLRGAVPIIFATYPVVAKIGGAEFLFNIVFFVTITSLIIQGTTISSFARKLGLALPLEKEGNDFGVELPEELESEVREECITAEMLNKADTLKDMHLSPGTLVMMIKRGDSILVPNGTMKLEVNDKLLYIKKKDTPQTHSSNKKKEG